MPFRNKQIIRMLGIYSALFLLYGVVEQIPRTVIPTKTLYQFASYGILYFMLIYWTGSVAIRVLNSYIRGLLFSSGILMILWILTQQIKYGYEPNDDLTRHLWYLFYFPIVLLPLFGFFISLHVGREEKKIKKARLLLPPAAVLIGLVLTNDYHQLVFGFLPGFYHSNTEYTHEVVYYIIAAWDALLLSAAIFHLFRKCRVSESRKYILIPIAGALFGAFWVIMDYVLPNSPYTVTEAFCAMFIMTFEACIQIGLIPTNQGYAQRFISFTIPAKIVNDENRDVYVTETAAEVFDHADEDRYMILQEYPINGGRIVWGEDLTKIKQIREMLQEQQQILSSEQELIRSENEAMARRVRAEEKNRLYYEIAVQVREKVQFVRSLLEEAKTREQNASILALAAVYTVHIKRRSNMMLLCREYPEVEINELKLCIRESLNYLKMLQIATSLGGTAEGMVAGKTLLYVYSFYEDAVEWALGSMNGLMVVLSAKDNKGCMRMVISNPPTLAWDADKEKYAKQGLSVESLREDELLYLTITFSMGGEAV